MPNDNLPSVFEFRGRSYSRTDRVVALGEMHMPLKHVASKEGQEVFLNQLSQEIWGDLDSGIFLLNHHGDTVAYEEIYPEPVSNLCEQTLSAVASLKQVGLFRNVKSRVPSQFHSAGSWAKALIFCQTLKRINLFNAPLWKVMDEVQRKARRERKDWAVATALIFAKAEELLLPHSEWFRQNDPSSEQSLPFGIIYQMVLQDITNILLEVEFSPFTQCRFYQQYLMPIYWDGHFLCGWKGAGLVAHWKSSWDVPRGKFVVL